jgi:hypothetical protein
MLNFQCSIFKYSNEEHRGENTRWRLQYSTGEALYLLKVKVALVKF